MLAASGTRARRVGTAVGLGPSTSLRTGYAAGRTWVLPTARACFLNERHATFLYPSGGARSSSLSFERSTLVIPNPLVVRRFSSGRRSRRVRDLLFPQSSDRSPLRLSESLMGSGALSLPLG